MTTEDDRLKICNYCVSFIDLLGHRNLYKGEGLLPHFTSEGDEHTFRDRVKKTIGVIDDLQSSADDFLKPLQSGQFSRKHELPPELQSAHDEMRKSRIVRQRWSDGVVYFAALNDATVRCPVSDVYNMIAQTGVLCFLGLAKEHPVRGSIDVAWATELHPGELYGAAVVKAYELESMAAQSPRIVVGERLVMFLDAWIQNQNVDPFSRYQRQLAEYCRAFISSDTDRLFFVDYLSDEFTEKITSKMVAFLYTKAVDFIKRQIVEHRTNENLTLLSRYGHLLTYYEHRRKRMAQPGGGG